MGKSYGMMHLPVSPMKKDSLSSWMCWRLPQHVTLMVSCGESRIVNVNTFLSWDGSNIIRQNHEALIYCSIERDQVGWFSVLDLLAKWRDSCFPMTAPQRVCKKITCTLWLVYACSAVLGQNMGPEKQVHMCNSVIIPTYVYVYICSRSKYRLGN